MPGTTQQIPRKQRPLMVRTLRGVFRLLILLFSVLQSMVSMLRLTRRNGGQLSPVQRAEEVQRNCAMIIRRMSVNVEIHGEPPRQGLLVTNHLSFLDMLLFGAMSPCVFVSKIEVKCWPIFGKAAALAGTVFVDRSKSAVGSHAITEVEDALRHGVCVLLFPEGTSTDGSVVLPFHPSFFEPAVVAQAEVVAAAVGYPNCPDHIESDICYYDDIVFFPRLMKALSLSSVSARLDYSPDHVVFENRKVGAVTTRQEVMALRQRQRAASEQAIEPELADREQTVST